MCQKGYLISIDVNRKTCHIEENLGHSIHLQLNGKSKSRKESNLHISAFNQAWIKTQNK